MQGVGEGHGEQAAVDPALVALSIVEEAAPVCRDDEDGACHVAEPGVAVLVRQRLVHGGPVEQAVAADGAPVADPGALHCDLDRLADGGFRNGFPAVVADGMAAAGECGEIDAAGGADLGPADQPGAGGRQAVGRAAVHEAVDLLREVCGADSACAIGVERRAGALGMEEGAVGLFERPDQMDDICNDVCPEAGPRVRQGEPLFQPMIVFDEEGMVGFARALVVGAGGGGREAAEIIPVMAKPPAEAACAGQRSPDPGWKHHAQGSVHAGDCSTPAGRLTSPRAGGRSALRCRGYPQFTLMAAGFQVRGRRGSAPGRGRCLRGFGAWRISRAHALRGLPSGRGWLRRSSSGARRRPGSRHRGADGGRGRRRPLRASR